MVFLAPYLSKQSKGGPGDLNPFTMALTRNSCFWCPSWTGVIEDRAAWQPYGEYVHERTGYAINYMLSFQPNYPPGNVGPGSMYHPPIAEWANTGLVNSGSNTIVDPSQGKWWRITQITRPAERCFMADTYHLFLSAPYAPASPLPGQQPTPTGNAAAGITIPGQCTFDWYRHGVYPSVKGAQFDPNAGKVGYNILYFDGHVTKAVDKTDGYRAIRMKYPG